ncbi:putative secreted protein (Por secretion system target) [Aquimarina sp. MAR_2010_214]|uniref:Ig-like domain-containing protein n=1 Tax=Aquimarina sp. MAR_2010_214 TaxID=1250026 RepID=UPI000C6FCEC5|nr:PKD domain-containing protein [Aquimarina sp. MAR_2010_214]PKV51638.1 putative secreted protein (Por secretion system target) [Aquimarina sp. MAR_2010_214]
MNRKLVQCFLLIIIMIGSHSTYGQSDDSYLLSDNQQDFINNLIKPKKNKPSAIKIANNQSFSFKLNVQNQTDQDLTLIGSVNDHQLSSFSFVKTDNLLQGNIILHDIKKAYTLYSKSNGQVFVKETDINTILCVDFEKANTEDVDTKTTISKAAPQLESLPGAPGIIYLDFDGEVVSGTSWLSGATINAQSPNFSNEKIIKVWKIMAEDFRPFNLNVTTRRDLFDAAPKNRRMMCIFTTTKDAAPDSGGVAYLYSFSRNSDNPCWVYNLGTRSAGETGSHEVGHTLGLSHDGKPGTTYYSGHGEWSPIMGWSANKPLGHWSSGEYPDATNTQDDIAIISGDINGVGFQNDDHGNTINDATSIKVSPAGVVDANQNFGLISTRNDKDIFTFAVETGNVTFNFNPDPDYPNLNIQARILNELGQQVAISDPVGLSASISENLSEGIYFIEIDGVGEGTLTNGYSDYSSLGNYSISGNYTPGDDKNPPLSDFEATKNCFVIDFRSTSTNRINSYLWDFGDGNTSTNENPTHTYATNGNYTVSLTTTNDSGNNKKEKANFIVIASPNQPIITDQNICSGESATLTATGNSDYKWYNTPTGGTSIASGSTYQTQALTTNKSYYIEGVIGGCITSTRTEVKIAVSESPNQPVSSNQTICSGESTTLTVTGNSEYKWYDTPTGGTSIASGTTYQTPVLDDTQIYYIEGVIGNCTTSTRTEVKAIVSPSPEQLVVTNQNICSGESATIVISGNSEYKWYTVSTGGNSIASGLTYETPVLDTNQTYYIEGTIGNCIAKTRAEVKIIVSENPEQPSIKLNQSHKLFVSSEFSSFQWYYKGEPIDDTNQAEYLPTKVGEYSVEVFNEAGCSVTSKIFDVDQSLLNLGQDNKTFIYYPNPVNDDEVLHIDGITANDYSIRIVSIQGQVLIDSTPTAQMNLSELADGLYIILINNKPVGKFVRE